MDIADLYVAAPDATTRCPTAGSAAAGCTSRPSRSAAGTTSATTSAPAPARRAATRVRPRHHALRPGQQLRTALRLGRDQLRPDPGEDFARHRDELVISTKAGWDMWPGPYGDLGSRKYLLDSPRPVAAAHGAGPRRHLLPPPLRPGHAARGDRWARWTPPCARARRATSASRPTRPSAPGRPSRSCASWARRCSSTSRRTRCSTAGSRRACSTCWASRASAASRFSPLAQGLLTDRYLDGRPRGFTGRRRPSRSTRTCSARRTSARCAR